jgi:predicted  nucleic acid-binding Zn-ribbon protein
MFRCERCGSRYSATHAAAMENCPRCMVRDQTESPLTFKAFQQSSTVRAARRAKPEGGYAVREASETSLR